MTNHPYPPLPEEEVLGFDRLDHDITGFTAAQMQAYVDADREQRKPLTDEQAVALYNEWDYGLMDDEAYAVIRKVEAAHGINPPPRPDAGNN